MIIKNIEKFSVDWSNSGGSEASVRVTKDNSEVPCTVKKIKQGLHVCSFTPKQVGLYLIDVYVDGTLLPGIFIFHMKLSLKHSINFINFCHCYHFEINSLLGCIAIIIIFR